MTSLLLAEPDRFDPSFPERLLPLLPPEKREVLQKIRHARARRESSLGWGMLVWAWNAAFFGEPLPQVRFSAQGKPEFADGELHFSLSHTDTLVCLALCNAGSVGVDAQVLSFPSDSVVRRVLTEAERAVFAAAADKALCFTRFWTMKEALVKQTGEGLSRSFQTLDFAPFAEQDRFTVFGLHFAVETFGNAVVSCCAKEFPTEPPRLLTQQEMEKILFLKKNG